MRKAIPENKLSTATGNPKVSNELAAWWVAEFFFEHFSPNPTNVASNALACELIAMAGSCVPKILRQAAACKAANENRCSNKMAFGGNEPVKDDYPGVYHGSLPKSADMAAVRK